MSIVRALSNSRVPRRAYTTTTRKTAGKTLATYTGVVAGSIVLWEIASWVTSPIFLPGPYRVAVSLILMTGDGKLPLDIAVSYFRILSGWLIGAAVAIPVGLAAGRIEFIRTTSVPFVNFFRFIPPIAFIGIAIIWFGLGEASKIVLIVYTSLFTVFLNVLAGAQSVARERIWAAECLGASRAHIFRTVVLPSTVPFMITGLRVAMGTSFMTVIAAEIVASNSGVGHLIWDARLFAQTARAFAGIFTLGMMGLVADLVFRLLLGRLVERYEVRF